MNSEPTMEAESRSERPVIQGMAPRRFAVLARSNFRCTYCGLDLLCDFDSLFGASVDHVKPRGYGGLDEDHNLVAACRTCNALKGDADVETIEEGRAIIRRRRGEFLAGFLGRANERGIVFPRHFDHAERFAPDILAALGMCAAQAKHVTRRLRTILRNAAAIESLLTRYEASPVTYEPTREIETDA